MQSCLCARKTYGGVDVWIHVLTSALVGYQFHAQTALPLEKEPQVPNEWAPESVWTMWRGQKSCSYRDSNSNPSAVQSV
jgi:hypothetical protein